MCAFTIDETTTPSLCLAGGLPRLTMSTAPEVDFDAEAPPVQRIQAIARSTPPADIMRYMKQLSDIYLSENDELSGTGNPNADARSRQFYEDDDGESAAVCKWRMDAPWTCKFVTKTVLDEMSVIQWIYAMRCLDEGFGQLRESKTREAMPWFVHATAAFKLLARTGAREGCMRFSEKLPPMFKAYVCQAWALLAQAYAHVAAANAAFAVHSADSMSQLCMDGIKHGACAANVASFALEVMRNEHGRDFLSKSMTDPFARACTILVAWGKFQAAVYYYYDATHQALALEHINWWIAVCADSPNVTKSMFATRTFLTYNSQGFVSSWVSSFKGLIGTAAPNPLPDVPDAQVTVPMVLPERLLFPVADT